MDYVYLNPGNNYIEKYACDMQLEWVLYVIATDLELSQYRGSGSPFGNPIRFI